MDFGLPDETTRFPTVVQTTVTLDSSNDATLALQLRNRGVPLSGDGGLYLQVDAEDPLGTRLPTLYDGNPAVRCEDDVLVADVDVVLEQPAPGLWTLTGSFNTGPGSLASIASFLEIDVVDSD